MLSISVTTHNEVTLQQPVGQRQIDALTHLDDAARQAGLALQEARSKLVALLKPLERDGRDDPDYSDSEDDLPLEEIVANVFSKQNLILDWRDPYSVLRELLTRARPQVWSAIREFNEARGKPALESVGLEKNFPLTRELMAALDGLGVKHLCMPVPDRDGTPMCTSTIDGSEAMLVDLTSINCLATLKIIDQEGGGRGGQVDPAPALWIVVSGKPEVTTSARRGPALLKSCVCFVDEDGNQMVRPLYGQVHERRALEFRQGDEALSEDVQMRALENCLNGAAPPLTIQRPDGIVDQVPMDCRVLTGITLNVMVAREVQRTAGAALQRLSYEATATVDAITAAAPAGVIDDLGRMYAQGACAIFETSRMGRALVDEFRTLPPGESRFFALGTPQPHLMGLVLRHKQRPDGRPEFVVKLYDSNISTHHQRMVDGDYEALTELAMEDWIASGVRQNSKMFHAYFPEDPGLASLFRWPAGNEPAQLRLYVADETMDSVELLIALMMDGRATEVSQFIARQVGQAASLAPGEMERRLDTSRGAWSFPTLRTVAAMDRMQDHPYLRGKSEVVRAYFQGVLAVPAQLFDARAKLRLVEGAMFSAMQSTSIDAALVIAEEALAAHDVLTPEQQKELLFPRLEGANRMLLPALRQRLATEPRADLRGWLEGIIALSEQSTPGAHPDQRSVS